MVHAINNGNEGTVDTRETDELALVGVLGDLYPHFVETGFIEQDRETLKSLERVDEDFVSVTIENKDKNGLFTVDKICAAIEATGFDSPSALAYSSPEVKTALDYDSSCFPASFVL